MSGLRPAALLCAQLALGACESSGGSSPPPDAGATDGGATQPGPDIPWLDRGVPPIALAPCPGGWREVRDDSGVTTCDPYPEGGPADCAFGEAHFPGEAGCRSIGAPCPAVDFPEDLPTDGSVVFVRAGATGGDGSRAAPFGALSDVPWRLRGAGWTVALAKGTYAGALPLTAGVVVVGACVAETRVTGVASSPSALTVTTRGAPAVVRNLAIVEPPGVGVLVGSGRALTLEGVLIARATQLGVQVAQAGSIVRASDLVVDETLAPPGLVAAGVVVAAGARFEATRALLGATVGVGLALQDASSAEISDSAIVHTTRAGLIGRGVNVVDGSELVATRVLVAHNADEGLYAAKSGSRVTLTDVVVADHDRNAVSASEGAALHAERVAVLATRGTALLAGLAGTTVTLVDVLVAGTTNGRALSVQEGGQLRAERLVLARNAGIGMLVSSSDTRVELADVAVRDTVPVAPGGRGFALQAQLGSRVSADRLLVEGALQFGLLAVTGASVSARDVHVARVGIIPEAEYGHAVGAVGGSIDLTRFAARDPAHCGVIVAPFSDGTPAALDLHSGVIERSEIGACVQIEGYDLARLTVDVVYRDNGTNLQATSLPVPEGSPLDAVPR